MSRLEKVTDMIVFNMLRTKNYVDGNFKDINPNIKVWAKKSSNILINEILSTASKNKEGNQGYPEYLIYDEKHELVIVIENKKDKNRHIFSNIDEKIKEYAVNGALWYAKKLKEKFNVIALAISGNMVGELLIDTYAWKKDMETFTNLNLHEILEIKEYRNILNKKSKNINSINDSLILNKEADRINEFLRNYLGVIEHERLYILGSILFSLEDPVFKMTYSTFNNDDDLSLFIWQTIERRIKGSKLNDKEIIINELKSTILSLKDAKKEGTKDKFPQGVLLCLIKDVDIILFDFYKNSELDLISTFFNVFLSYSTSGGSDLGIVFTPSHITKLFSDLANINLDSKILDICAGTGGFLTSAWKKILLNEAYTFTEKEYFRENNLYGIEKEKSIYTIIALNMFLNKDGRSNLFKGDCFSFINEIKNYECNVGFINPPYSDAVYSEISFVELMLDSLLPNSIGIAILPINSISSRTKKHSDLVTVKERILQKHSLIASIQMPNNLFYPKGTETIILIFETYKANNNETWFAKYEDNYELIKHQKSRTPTKESEKSYKNLLNAYQKKLTTDFSFSKSITPEQQWVYTLLLEYEYDISENDLQETVNEYISYLFRNNYI